MGYIGWTVCYWLLAKYWVATRDSYPALAEAGVMMAA
jgi:hypothetical protein